ncbi:MAG: flavodoxin domain-containing protein [Candidatus Nanoarchaeia archaeon]|nr:flavodoxin domain-containing protein [Candidatus Nanoarchaeia archaeon]
MSIAIVYKTIYGSTGKYAKWLSEAVKSDVFEMDDVKNDLLKNFDSIIVMSGTYGGKMSWVDFLKNNWEILKNKKLTAISVGAVPMNHWWSKINYFFVPKFIKDKIKYFKIYGKFKDKGKEIEKINLKEIIEYIKN